MPISIDGHYIAWHKVPVPYMIDGVQRYVLHGIPPGSFLTALFSNNLKESFARADENNTAAMRTWVIFMRWELPSQCHGSPEAVADWIAAGGMLGREKVDATG